MPKTLTKKRRKPSRTGAVIDVLDQLVWRQKDTGKRDRGYSLVDRRLTEQYERNNFNVLEDIDIDAVFDRFVRNDERFADAVKHIQHNKALYRKGIESERLYEHVTDGIKFSQFERFLDTCVRLGTLSFCNTARVDMILNLVGRINVDCTTNTLVTDPFLIEDDFDISNPGASETPLGGLADPIEVTVPDRHYVKIGYALRRDLFCGGLAGRIRDLIEGENGVAAKFDRAMAKRIVPLVFDLYAPTQNPWAFQMDGCSWETYYTSTGSPPWVNMTDVAAEFNTCQYGMFCAVEDAFNKIEHPRTGDPMSCCDTYQIISGGGTCTEEKFRALLGFQRVSSGPSCNGNDCEETIAFDRAARAGWGTFQSSRFLTKYLRDSMMAMYGPGTGAAFTAAEVDQMVERTWIAGCPQQAFKMTIEWDREEVTLEGRNTYQNWNQEILWMKKWSEKTGLMVENPWAVHKVRGLPDGKTAANLFG